MADDDSGSGPKTSCGGGDYHRFNFTIPDYQSRRGQPVYAYGINWPGTGGGNTLLLGCPQNIP